MKEEQAGDQPRQAEESAGGPSEEELRERLEEELKRITVRDILLQTVVTLVNLGGQRLGLTEGTREIRDLEQVRVAIDGVRSLLPLLETNPQDAAQVRPIRDALAQLQMAYANEVGAGAASPAAEQGPPTPGGPPTGGPGAERKGTGEKPQQGGPSRLWVPPGSS